MEAEKGTAAFLKKKAAVPFFGLKGRNETLPPG
jgi:hypothetical protein